MHRIHYISYKNGNKTQKSDKFGVKKAHESCSQELECYSDAITEAVISSAALGSINLFQLMR